MPYSLVLISWFNNITVFMKVTVCPLFIMVGWLKFTVFEYHSKSCIFFNILVFQILSILSSKALSSGLPKYV